MKTRKKTSSPKGGTKNFSPTKKAGSSVEKCPLANTNRTKPCDVELISLKQSQPEAGAGRMVKALLPTGQRPPAKPNPKLRPAQRDVAQTYDVVLEVVSAFPIEKEEFKKKEVALVEVNCGYKGTCSTHEPMMLLVCPTTPDSNDEPAIATAFKKSVTVRSQAKSLPADRKGQCRFQDLAQMFKLDDSQVKTIEVTLESCGVRTSGKVKKSFRGLVRVYRKEQFDITLTVPSFKEFKRSKAKDSTYDVGKVKFVTKETVENKSWAGKLGSEVREDGSLKELAVTTNTPLMSEKLTVSDEDGEVVEDKEWESRFKFSIKRNSVELSLSETVTKIVSTILKFKKLIKAACDIQEWVPKVGYSFSLSMALMEGSVTGSLGWRPDAKLDTEEYKWVTRFGEITFKLTIFQIAFTLQFGVEASSPAILNWAGEKLFEFIAKVALELKNQLDLSKTIQLFGAEDDSKSDKKGHVIASLSSPSTLDLFLQFKVNVYGYACEARGGFEAGLTVGVDVIWPLNFHYKVTRTPGRLYAYWSKPGKSKPSPRWEHEIWGEKDIWDDYILSD